MMHRPFLAGARSLFRKALATLSRRPAGRDPRPSRKRARLEFETLERRELLSSTLFTAGDTQYRLDDNGLLYQRPTGPSTTGWEVANHHVQSAVVAGSQTAPAFYALERDGRLMQRIGNGPWQESIEYVRSMKTAADGRLVYALREDGRLYVKEASGGIWRLTLYTTKAVSTPSSTTGDCSSSASAAVPAAGP
jgi:hypothetical protein